MRTAKASVLYIDQFGARIWARTVKELRAAVGGGRISKMYVDKANGQIVHIGYVVGKHWLAAYAPIEKPAGATAMVKGGAL